MKNTNIKGIAKSFYTALYGNIDVLKVMLFILISLYLFQGFLGYGLQFDKVFRVNNIVPFINDNASPYNQAISKITLFGTEIPLMYKQYISSLSILRYLPLKYFDNYYYGLKLIDLICFFLTIIGTYFIAKKYIKNAHILAFLLLLNPILYPEIFFGFTTNIHVFFIAFSLHLFYRFYSEKKSKFLLFSSTFFMFFTCNLFYYNVWIFASLIISAFIFYPLKMIKTLKDLKNIIAIIVGALLGFINYVIYNIEAGFPSIKPLLLKIFNTEAYNNNPIDFKEAKPIWEEISIKLSKIFPQFWGDIFTLVVIVFIIVILIYATAALILFKQGRIAKNKIYFFPIVTFIIVFFLILISPNTTRAGHYIFLSPFLELSIMFVPIVIYKAVPKITFKFANYFLIFILAIFLYGSTEISAKSRINKGTGHFSPAIFELNKYLSSNDINSNSIIHTQWGFYSQLYFLNKGECSINSIVFQLLKKTENVQETAITRSLKGVISSNKELDALYFPVYNHQFEQIQEVAVRTVEKYGGEISLEKQFKEQNGADVFKLLKVSNLNTLYENIVNRYKKLPITDSIIIKKCGVGGNGDALWIICLGHDINTKVIVDNTICNTMYYDNKLTCSLPKEIVVKNGKYKVELLDTKNNIKSKPAILNYASKAAPKKSVVNNSPISITRCGYGDNKKAIWILCDNHTEKTKVYIGDLALTTTYYSDHLTAVVPPEYAGKEISIRLIDSESKISSNIVTLK